MAKKATKAAKTSRKPARAIASKPVRKTATKPATKPTKKLRRKPRTTSVKASSAARAVKGTFGLVGVASGFTANDAVASIRWYCDVLGFTVKERWELEGEFRGAQLVSGAVVLNIGQDDWKLGRDRVKGQGTRLYIMTGPGIDQYAEAVKARGGRLDHEPQDGWGMRAFSITDPDGFKLTFMTPAKP